jgi:hypothetical protein
MGIINISTILNTGIFSSRGDELIEWLEECCGPRIFIKTLPKNGIIPFCQSSNWRLIAISYALRRAYPDTSFSDSGWVLEFDNDSDLLMFKFRWC